MSAHGTRSRYNQGCRCDACRNANRLYDETRRRARGVLPMRYGCDCPHGSMHRYADGCRCLHCRRANTVRRRENRYRDAGNPPHHGTASGYRNYNCRCEPCQAAGSIANRRDRERRKAKVSA